MRSMTGYGRRQITVDGRELTVEIKTVNHRFLDIALRFPRALTFAEEGVRKQLGKDLRRGHVDINATYRNMRTDARVVRVDEGLAAQYMAAIRSLGTILNGTGEIDFASFIAAQPDVLTVSVAEEDMEAVQQLISDVLDDTVKEVVRMREIEGENLKKDLTMHLDLLSELRDQIEAMAPEVPKAYQKKLQDRLGELGVKEIDPARLAQEVALMADRCAIDEELSRLVSHIAQMRSTMEQEGEVGRRLDFLTQELNREVNTIGSKASDARIATLVVAAKSEIEKIREQVQNVE